ncbi:hypothetical protein RB213_008023 [Colletotrichum asianum]
MFRQTSEAEDFRVKHLVSAFDVDGPCTVATQFNSEWEVLRHPDLRAMCLLGCGAGQRKRSVSNVEGGEDEEPQEKGKGKGKDKGKDKEKTEDLEAEIPHDIRLMLEFEEWPKHVPLYRVVHKVKGNYACV